MSPRRKPTEPPKRARKGSGSVIARAGKFVARVSAVDAVTKERVQRQRTFDDRKAAEVWLRQQIALAESGERQRRVAGGVTLGKFLRDYYASDRRGAKGKFLSPRTAAVDLEFCERYVLRRMPALAEQPLGKVTTETLAYLFRSLALGDETHAPLARATVSRVYRILGARFRHAVRLGHLQASPMRAELIPVDGKAARKKRTLSAAQVQALGVVHRNVPFGLFFLFQCWTGCRPGEAAALLWSDVDLDAARVVIRGALVRSRTKGAKAGEGAWAIRLTKTETTRSVVLPGFLVEELRVHRRAQAADQLLAGAEWVDNGLVFCNRFGWPVHLDLLAQRHLPEARVLIAYQLLGRARPAVPAPSKAEAYRTAREARARADAQALQDAGVLPTSLYELRHSAATIMLAANIHPKVAADRLGHARVSTTLQVYSHVTAPMQAAAVETLEATILGTPRKASGG